MKKSVGVLLGIFIALFSLGALSLISASSSGTITNFNIPGCDQASAGTCYRATNPLDSYYCAEVNGEYVARNVFDIVESGACTGADSVSGNEDDCCPAGYYCGADSNDAINPNAVICRLNTEFCSDFGIDDCEDPHAQVACMWFDAGDGGVCRDEASLACGEYVTESACNEDEYSLGQHGLNTEVCYDDTVRGNLIVVEGSCRCEWDPVGVLLGDGAYCEFRYEEGDHIWTGSPDDRNEYECVVQQTAGPCENGLQISEWTVSVEDVSDGSIVTDTGVLAAMRERGCVNGSLEMSCGRPVVMLPGFTWVNVVLVLVVLAIIYILLKNCMDKSKKKTVKRTKKTKTAKRKKR